MTQRNSDPPGRLRIVGGEWRGRRLSVLDQPGLRPTPDRVRETLFNWLAPLIKGAWCLDLFAGTGALGFEAASRGADRVVMIEKLANVVRVLHENRLLLDARQIEVIHADASPWLAGQAEPFNLVFLDPPFAEDLLGPSCAAPRPRRLAREGRTGLSGGIGNHSDFPSSRRDGASFVPSRRDRCVTGWRRQVKSPLLLCCDLIVNEERDHVQGRLSRDL